MKFGRRILISATALLAMACATVEPPPADLPGEVIVYAPSYGPFCFGCVFTTITAAEDGRVWIEREKLTGSADQMLADMKSSREPRSRVSREVVTVTPVQMDAFRKRLAPYRPQSRLILSGEACASLFSDLGGITVSWQSAGVKNELIYDFGCDADLHARMRDDLVAAPGLLGIAMPDQTSAATTRLR